jgi:hypothetical protein
MSFDNSMAKVDSLLTAHPFFKKLTTASGYSPEFKRIVAQAQQDAVESGR